MDAVSSCGLGGCTYARGRGPAVHPHRGRVDVQHVGTVSDGFARLLCVTRSVHAVPGPARQGARKRITAAESRVIVAARARAHLASVQVNTVPSDDGNKKIRKITKQQTKKNRFCAAKRRGKSAKKRWELYRRALAERRAAYEERRQAVKKMKKEDPVRPHGSGARGACAPRRDLHVLAVELIDGVCARPRAGLCGRNAGATEKV